MADTNNRPTNSQDPTVSPSANNGSQAENSAQAGADALAKLADAATSEGSSINSEDYRFLKLNGNC